MDLDRWKYIPIDRIPVRPLPHKYSPKVGVCLVEDRQVKGARHVFSISLRARTYFLSAETQSEVRTVPFLPSPNRTKGR